MHLLLFATLSREVNYAMEVGRQMYAVGYFHRWMGEASYTGHICPMLAVNRCVCYPIILYIIESCRDGNDKCSALSEFHDTEFGDFIMPLC